MKATEMRFYSLICLCGVLNACGNLQEVTSGKQELQVIAHGTYAAPETATGNAAPNFYEMSLQRLVLVSEGGNVEFTPGSTETMRIVNRPQIIYSKDIKEYEGDTFSEVQVYFDSAIKVGAKYRNDYELNLAQAMHSKAQEFKIKKSKDLKISVKIEWQNTINRDTDARTEDVLQPAMTIDIN